MKQQNKNFLFNVGYQFVMYLFPLISAAYISRVIGAAVLGQYSFVNSVATICGMFGLLGNSNYGNREIAKVKDDYQARSNVFSKIYSLQLLFTGVTCGVYILVLLLFSVPNIKLYVIELVYLLSVAFDVTWLFFGLEQFKTTLLRNLIFKSISTIAVFLFVHTPNDIYIYAAIIATSTLASQIYLFCLGKKQVSFSLVINREQIEHFKKCLVLFIPVIAFGLYRTMDKAMIGIMSTPESLSYYEYAERVILIPIMVINALGTVMMPHMAYVMSNEEEGKSKYREIIAFSMKLLLTFAAFACMGLIIWAEEIVVVLFGSGFVQSRVLVQLLAPTILASSWANVIRTQYLIPKGYDAIYVRSTVIGLIINLLANLLLIRIMGAAGACIGTIFAECAIAIYQSMKVSQHIESRKYGVYLMVGLIKAATCLVLTWGLVMRIDHDILRLGIAICTSCVLFVVSNWKMVIVEFLGIKH